MMARASLQNDKEPTENTIDLTLALKEMKRNFSRFMTKLGAHITHLAIYGANNALKISKKGFGFVKNKAMPKTLKVISVFTSLKNKILNKINNTQDYFYNLNDSVCDAKVNKGFFKATKILLSSIGKSIWSFRRAVVTVFNWVAPVVSIVFLVNVVTYANKLDYGVSVECNGEKLGLISEETDYDEAEMAMQQRITYVEGNEKVVITPKLSVQVVRNSKEIVKPNQLVDKMIVNSEAEISNAYGLYVDGKFLGALTDRKPVMDTLANILAKYQTPGAKSVNFQKSVEYKEGLYLKSSLVSSDKIISLLTSNNQVEAYYKVQNEDTPIKIAAKNGITLEQLSSLNPNIQADCKIGDSVILNRAEPYMPVQVVKNIQYTDALDYETVKTDNDKLYKGSEKVLQKGEEGEANITAEVTYMNGYEVGRTVINTAVTKQPVTEKISVGTKILQPTKGLTITGNGQYAWPVAGGHVTSSFGGSRRHKGVDIAAPAGTSIFAADSGTVIMAQWYYGYGNCTMVRNGDGNVTVYGHQSKIVAKVGQTVQKGELIGLVGSTGDSDGNHLHFEVRVNGKNVNPLGFIS